MKYRLFTFIFGIVLFVSCSDMFDNVKPYEGDIVYPAKFDTIYGFIGYERVEIDLLKAGRLPANEIKMGKAKKTVIQYDQEKIVIDSLCSWVNIKNIPLPKLYRFRIYTIDEFENQSVPQVIALIPYTAEDKDLLEVPIPRFDYSESGATISWPAGISSVMLHFCGLTYSYIDKDGVLKTGDTKDTRPVIPVENLEPGVNYIVDIDYKVVPVLNETTPILDTVEIARPLTVRMP